MTDSAYDKVKNSASGKGLYLNEFDKKENSKLNNPPQKFLKAISNPPPEAFVYAENTEIECYKKFIVKSQHYKDKGWNLLDLQEKKVINGLPSYKIPAYLGFRTSFEEGISRKDFHSKPIFALLEVASACNIKCPFCFQSDSTFTTKEFMGIIDKKLAFSVIDQIDEMRIRGLTIASRGEPLLHPDLNEILLHIAKKENIIELKINTNAKRLNEEILSNLINSPVNIFVVSTDHYKKNQYEKFRHGSRFENFVDNISRINILRKKLNREETFYTRASGVAVDEKMNLEKFDEFYKQYFDESAIVNMSERWDTYNNKKIEKRLRPCGLPFERIYIWHDGVTNPCDTDYKSYLSPGNIKEKSLKECWMNLNKLRQDMLSGRRKNNNPCDRCDLA